MNSADYSDLNVYDFFFRVIYSSNKCLQNRKILFSISRDDCIYNDREKKKRMEENWKREFFFLKRY